MFDNLTFNSDAEKTEFAKYIHLKGECLHKQVYDILSEANNGSVTYYELSSLIRYDKKLRDKLYIYFATAEEYLKAQLTDRYDANVSSKYIHYPNEIKNLLNNLKARSLDTPSILYYKLNIDFEALLQVCYEKNIIEIDNVQKQQLNKLRNHTMHHSMLLFGQAHNLKEAKDNFKSLEKQLNAFVKLLPEEYRQGFLSDINKLNGRNEQKYLNKFYLEITDVGIHIKENN
ncbi:MAG TPA: hypothetical protein IAB25_00695 [Candidatus Coproplasma stercoravium]|nr:hypothetical protein [Candidatus Coproplasma stercoravium]